ncbi:MAG: hypothetical protein HOC74_25600 [Gemmatimonadetes bacterium]|jgi:hypothetical protein|nr:hypothetical protein [Gemmatimonadota bacterium]
MEDFIDSYAFVVRAVVGSSCSEIGEIIAGHQISSGAGVIGSRDMPPQGTRGLLWF